MCKLYNNSGFTLIELLIAIVIITIGSLGVGSLTASIIRGNSFSKKITTATTLAQDTLENAKRVGFANAGTLPPMENYGTIASFRSYKRVTSVAPNTPATPLADMITVTVTVYWDTDAHSVVLRTILAQ